MAWNHIEFFPDGYNNLSKELATGLHPKLEKQLAESGLHPTEDVDMRIALIASYCQIVVDGVYTLAERDKLCAILAGRLEVLRELPAPQTILPLN